MENSTDKLEVGQTIHFYELYSPKKLKTGKIFAVYTMQSGREGIGIEADGTETCIPYKMWMPVEHLIITKVEKL